MPAQTDGPTSGATAKIEFLSFLKYGVAPRERPPGCASVRERRSRSVDALAHQEGMISCMEALPDLEHGGMALGQTMTGTVRWFKNEKGYGRITGDDDYFYFVHFSSIETDGYKT